MTEEKNAEPAEPKKKKPKPPVEFSQEIADKICDRLAGGEFLTEICKSPGIPDRRTVQRWISQDAKFAEDYSRARELLADLYFERIIKVASDGSGGVGADGKVDWENVNRSRLKVDAIKWVCARLLPHKYGEKHVTQLSGPNDGPIEIAGSTITDEQRVRVLQVLMAKASAHNGHAPVRLLENGKDLSWDD